MKRRPYFGMECSGEVFKAVILDCNGMRIGVGLISAAFSSLVYIPPQEEIAGLVSDKPCL